MIWRRQQRFAIKGRRAFGGQGPAVFLIGRCRDDWPDSATLYTLKVRAAVSSISATGMAMAPTILPIGQGFASEDGATNDGARCRSHQC
jgi:hypothetical protein